MQPSPHAARTLPALCPWLRRLTILAALLTLALPIHAARPTSASNVWSKVGSIGYAAHTLR